jgi:hypothetical protein
VHVLRGRFQARLDVAQFVEFDLPVHLGLDLGEIALRPSHQVSCGARHPRQLFRPEDDQSDHADQAEFGHSDVKHGGAASGFGKRSECRDAANTMPASLPAWRRMTDSGRRFFLRLDVDGLLVRRRGGRDLLVDVRRGAVGIRVAHALTAEPRSEPMFFSFFVSNTIITITSTISQCQMLNEPIANSFAAQIKGPVSSMGGGRP